jgi:tRNA/tmRNA/rRNA uracil-C5-methylase (TrmA/RlmC/RlmD family)
MQANAEAYGELLKRMPRHVPRKARVVEMYAGVGTIGFSLLTNETLDVKHLRCVESSSAVAEAWERTRDELREELRHRASLQIEKAERIAVESTKDCDVLIVDPPRKGLDAKLRAVLTDVEGLSDDLKTLLYVSCGFDSFTRDSDELLASGMWEIVHHESFVFFPGTNHIEIFAVFSRKRY